MRSRREVGLNSFMGLQPPTTWEISQCPIVPTMVRIGFPAVLGSLVFTLFLDWLVARGSGAGALAATGDTLAPLLIMGGGTVLNMILAPPLVLGWRPIPWLGILGAALGQSSMAFGFVVMTAVSGLVALFMLFSRGWQRTLVKGSAAEKTLQIGIAHAGENSS